jgi:patatin-like phospholipase/acyl hydrolase
LIKGAFNGFEEFMETRELLVLFLEDRKQVFLQEMMEVFFMVIFFRLIILSYFWIKYVRE